MTETLDDIAPTSAEARQRRPKRTAVYGSHKEAVIAKSTPIPPDDPLAYVPPEDLATFGYAVAKLIAGVWRREQAERPALKAAS